MKKFSLLLALLIAVGAFAQKRGHKKDDAFTPEQKTKLMVMKMSLELDLTEKQEAQITPIIAEKVNKMEERMDKFKDHKKEERPEISNDEKFQMALDRLEEQKALQNKMKNILDKDQYAQWKKMHKKHGEKRKEMVMKNHKKKNGDAKKRRDHNHEEMDA